MDDPIDAAATEHSLDDALHAYADAMYALAQMIPPPRQESTMTDLISLPRSVVEQLVDPSERVYLYGDEDDGYFCNFCHEWQVTLIDHNWGYDHTQDCPVRLVQEALAAN